MEIHGDRLIGKWLMILALRFLLICEILAHRPSCFQSAALKRQLFSSGRGRREERMMSRRWVWLAVSVLGALTTVAFALLAGGRSSHEREDSSKVLHEHRFQAVQVPTRTYGQDCSAAGESSCTEGACIHFRANPDTGWACSRHCTNDSDCAGIDGAHCRSIWQGPPSTTAFCIPPSSFQPES